jgi:hypothetical protein
MVGAAVVVLVEMAMASCTVMMRKRRRKSALGRHMMGVVADLPV